MKKSGELHHYGEYLCMKNNKNRPRLLHDGRARNFEEAILWHGGEAKTKP